MAYRRSPIHLFELNNAAYASATVGFYAVDETTQEATTDFITLYDASTGLGELANPQVLGPDGRFSVTVWAEAAYVAQISGALGEQTTGVVYPSTTLWRSDWVSGAGYAVGDLIRDGAAGDDTANLYACIVDHTAGVWATDLAAGYWELILDVASTTEAAAAAAASAASAAVDAATATTQAAIAVAAAAGVSLTGSSTTNLIIGGAGIIAGSTLTLNAQSTLVGKQWLVGGRFIVSSASAPTCSASGTLATYNSVTGATTILVDTIGIAGTHADWNVQQTGAIGSSGVVWGGTAGGTANALTIAATPPQAGYTAGVVFPFLASLTNTSATTVNIDGLGAKAIKSVAGAALAGGEIQAAGQYLIVYEGAAFRLLNPSGAGGVWGGSAGGSANAITLTASPSITAYTPGQPIRFLAVSANTSSVTLNAGPGALAVLTPAGAALVGGEIQIGLVEVVPEGTALRLTLPPIIPRADVASASTADLASVAGPVRITGTVTITSFGAGVAGVTKDIVFGGILTLTHNGTSLILPGSANITTAAGDTARALSLGSSNWVVLTYTRATGKPLVTSEPINAVTVSTIGTLSDIGRFTSFSGGASASYTFPTLSTWTDLFLDVGNANAASSGAVINLSAAVGTIGPNALTAINLYPGESARFISDGSKIPLVLGRSNAGGRIFVREVTLAVTSATWDIEDGWADTEFDAMEFDFKQIVLASNETLAYRLKTATSSGYITSSNYAMTNINAPGSGTFSGATTTSGLISGNFPGSSAGLARFKLIALRHNTASIQKNVFGYGAYEHTAGTATGWINFSAALLSGATGYDGVLTGLRMFSNSGGNINSGAIVDIWGIRTK